MARVLPLPASLHCEILEDRLILRAFRERWMQQQGRDVYPAMTMLSRNDIIAEALRTLHHPYLRSFMMYVESLATALPGGDTTVYPAMPQKVYSSEGNATAAERTTTLLLAEGEGSMWNDVRKVIAELPFVPHRRSFDSAQLCFRLGAYGHRSFVGLHAATAQHSAVCTLLNAFIRMIHPGHEWTSLSVQVDSLAGPHRDYQNFGLNLVVGVSLFEQGQIWVEHEGGRYFEEVGTSLVPGILLPVSGSAVLFDARQCWHAVRQWSGGNRITLIAYCIGQHYSLAAAHRARLLALGFSPPA